MSSADSAEAAIRGMTREGSRLPRFDQSTVEALANFLEER